MKKNNPFQLWKKENEIYEREYFKPGNPETRKPWNFKEKLASMNELLARTASLQAIKTLLAFADSHIFYTKAPGRLRMTGSLKRFIWQFMPIINTNAFEYGARVSRGTLGRFIKAEASVSYDSISKMYSYMQTILFERQINPVEEEINFYENSEFSPRQ